MIIWCPSLPRILSSDIRRSCRQLPSSTTVFRAKWGVHPQSQDFPKRHYGAAGIHWKKSRLYTGQTWWKRSSGWRHDHQAIPTTACAGGRFRVTGTRGSGEEGLFCFVASICYENYVFYPLAGVRGRRYVGAEITEFRIPAKIRENSSSPTVLNGRVGNWNLICIGKKSKKPSGRRQSQGYFR